jgi:hypothetical protein
VNNHVKTRQTTQTTAPTKTRKTAAQTATRQMIKTLKKDDRIVTVNSSQAYDMYVCEGFIPVPEPEKKKRGRPQKVWKDYEHNELR